MLTAVKYITHVQQKRLTSFPERAFVWTCNWHFSLFQNTFRNAILVMQRVNFDRGGDLWPVKILSIAHILVLQRGKALQPRAASLGLAQYLSGIKTPLEKQV